MMILVGLVVAVGPATLVATALFVIARLAGLAEWPRWRRRRGDQGGRAARAATVARTVARPAS